MKRFRYLYLLVVMMVAAFMVAGCGSKATKPATDDKPTKADEEIVEPNEAEDPNDDVTSETEEQQQEDATDETDVADAVDSETEGTEAEAPGSDGEEKNEYGLTEEEMQQLYDCVKESVLTGYIEPNGISPEEFSWPELDDHSWNYLAIMYLNYIDFGTKYDTTNYVLEKPNDLLCQLINSVFDGMTEWSDSFSDEFYESRLSVSPFPKWFSENIDFTN